MLHLCCTYDDKLEDRTEALALPLTRNQVLPSKLDLWLLSTLFIQNQSSSQSSECPTSRQKVRVTAALFRPNFYI